VSSAAGGAGQPALVEDLCRPSAWPHPADDVRLVETHISWVFLAGAYAYKLKKPVNLGFLDFRDRERRVFFCNEELRLNRRLAPELYLEVTGACEGPQGWRMGPFTEGAEPAVKMRRFPDPAQLDRALDAGRLDAGDMETFAKELARFHASAPCAGPQDGFGTPEAVAAPALENFAQIDGGRLSEATGATLGRLRAWTHERMHSLAPAFTARLAGGFVRECHGDLHLANLVRIDDRIAAFDGIEFDPALRWIDVLSDAAFLLMDLESRGRPDLGWTFFNAWLERLGGQEGLALLPWYLVYRHLVRTKVDAIRLRQPGLAAEDVRRLHERLDRHVGMAARRAEPGRPLAILMCGYSGSGKSHLARRIAPRLGAIRLRSDVERKRLHGLDPWEPGAAPPGEGLYTREATERTYRRLAALARGALGAGLAVIVDAAFLGARRRREFIRLAEAGGARAVVLRCDAKPEVLRQRVASRTGDPSDAGLAVLEDQLARSVEPGDDEAPWLMRVRTDAPVDAQALADRLEAARS
jgi:aminoglycoside phosphotransferase family enzyme/predicted kinase